MAFWKKFYKSKYTGAEIDAAVAKAGNLPATTSTDAGKALVVDEEGKIVAGEAGGSYLEVLFSADQTRNLICNHTYAEIADAINSNKTIIARFAYGMESVITLFDIKPQLSDNRILFIRQHIDIDPLTSKANINTTTITYTNDSITGSATLYMWSVTNDD